MFVLIKLSLKRSASHICLSWFSCGSSNMVEWEFRVFFVEGGVPRENLRSKERTGNNLPQPTYSTEPESNPGHIAGRRALSPQRYTCSPLPLYSCMEVSLPRFVFPLQVLIFVVFVHCEAPAIEITQQLTLFITDWQITNCQLQIHIQKHVLSFILSLPSKRQG